MGAIDKLFNAADPREEELRAWKENNPEGFQRELEEQREYYLHAVDAIRHEQGQTPLNAQERADYHTPEDPHEIAKMHGELINGLGEEGREWLDNQRDVANNLDLATQMHALRDEYADPSSIDGLIAGTKQICDQSGINPIELAERYKIDLNPELHDQLTGATQEADNTTVQNMEPPQEYEASVTSSVPGGMG